MAKDADKALSEKFDARIELRFENVRTALERFAKMQSGTWKKVADHSRKYRAVVEAIKEMVSATLAPRGKEAGSSVVQGIYARYGAPKKKGRAAEEEEEEEEEE